MKNYSDTNAASLTRRYDPLVVLGIFKKYGSLESLAPGEVAIAEGIRPGLSSFSSDHDIKIYYHLVGELTVSVNGNCVSTIDRGEVFGELIVGNECQRLATVTARTHCQLLSMSRKVLESVFREEPYFLFMLLDVSFGRLRRLADKYETSRSKVRSASVPSQKSTFDRQSVELMLAHFEGAPPPIYARGQTIVHKGDAATQMYVVLNGCVEISIGSRAIEHVYPFGCFGEAALFTGSRRTAEATAIQDTAVLPLNLRMLAKAMHTRPRIGHALLKLVARRTQFWNQSLSA